MLHEGDVQYTELFLYIYATNMNEKAKWNGTSKENYDEKAQI